VFKPENQTITDTPERHSKRRARRWKTAADVAGMTGEYAGVAVLTALFVYPDLRFAFFVLAPGLLLVGVAIGTALRWRAS
jgi:hypothetical protein